MTPTPQSTAERLHAEAAAKYRQIAVAEFRGEPIDANELKECLTLLGLPVSALKRDAETLRRRSQAFDAVMDGIDAASGFSVPSTTASHQATENRRERERYVDEEFARLRILHERTFGPGFQPVSPQVLGPGQFEPNPVEAAVRNLNATNRLRSRIHGLRAAQRKHDEAEWLVNQTEWARGEAAHLEKQLDRLRSIAAEGVKIRETLPTYLPAIDEARAKLEAIRGEAVVDGAELSVDRLKREEEPAERDSEIPERPEGPLVCDCSGW